MLLLFTYAAFWGFLNCCGLYCSLGVLELNWVVIAHDFNTCRKFHVSIQLMANIVPRLRVLAHSKGGLLANFLAPALRFEVANQITCSCNQGLPSGPVVGSSSILITPTCACLWLLNGLFCRPTFTLCNHLLASLLGFPGAIWPRLTRATEEVNNNGIHYVQWCMQKDANIHCLINLVAIKPLMWCR